jgi:hypothetical protein
MRRFAILALLFAWGSAPAHAQDKRAQLDGVWILARSATTEMTLTTAGEAARARYDYLRDDPAMRCIPASFTRVMHTPSPPIEVRQHAKEVQIKYEFMDVHRRVPVAPGMPPEKAPYTVRAHPHLGRSVARYDGDVLVIDTAGQRAGILDTLGAPGLVQSNQMRTEERFIPDGDRMRVVVTHHDPLYYTKLVVTYPYQRLPGAEILPWDCTPEEAGYKRFREKKNQR